MTGQNLAQQKHPVTAFLPAQHVKPKKQSSPTFPNNENQHGQTHDVNNDRDFGNVLPTTADYKPQSLGLHVVILHVFKGRTSTKKLDVQWLASALWLLLALVNTLYWPKDQ